LRKIADSAGLLQDGRFIDKAEFKHRKYLGSGGIGLFRDTLWSAIDAKKDLRRIKPQKIAEIAKISRARIHHSLGI